MRLFARFIFFRSIYNIFKKNTRSKRDTQGSFFDDLDVKKAVKSIKEEGYYEGLHLPKKSLDKILDYCEFSPCYGDQNTELGFFYKDYSKIKKAGYNFVTAHYPNLIGNCTEIRDLTNDSKLWVIAEQYLGLNPVLLTTAMHWVFPKNSTDKERDTWGQKFHSDVDDYKFLKFFFYLTDVDNESAPHTYVRKSHITMKLSHQFLIRRRSDEDIEEAYGKENIISICGNRGLGFVGDTFCFHKAAVPKSKDRLLLQIQFAKRDYMKTKDIIDVKTQKMILK